MKKKLIHVLLISFLGLTILALTVCPAISAEPQITPNLFGERELERTGFQQAGPYGPGFDLRTDYVMPYGISNHAISLIPRWIEAEYVPHLMTGVSWGGYEDFLDGKFDGIDHWDDAQVDPQGKQILHGPRTPYMVPSIAFSRCLEDGLKKAIDSGVVAVHLEEPEFWARAGFGDSFKREWQIYYNEPWIRPDSSCDAQYRASKLKYYLYKRMLDRLCGSLKEYSLVKHKRSVRFYVPTHSLLNYSQWSIVSPESALLDLPGIDGMIAQVWTGTARTENTYQGKNTERTFETAYLEYCIMQEMVRGTEKRMYFLHDPIEDNPAHDWNDYRSNYICTLVASLLQPDIWYYEVCPWPNRVFHGKYPAGDPDAQSIPGEYATVLNTVFQQLRDMEQPEVSWEKATDGIGVFLGDSAMFQRAEPAYKDGKAPDYTDPVRPDIAEIHRFSSFYGLTLPLVKHGVPVRAVQLDNVLRYPGYLDRYKILLLSYEYQKPLHPGVHAVLADWVARGGTLVYIGGETDPFHDARDWWNTKPQDFKTPTEHLMQLVGLDRTPGEGKYTFGKGNVVIVRKHPAYFSRSKEKADELRSIVRECVEANGEKMIERNYFLLRRGPYLIAATMNESVSSEPLELQGKFVDLLNSDLQILDRSTITPGTQVWLLDLEKITAKAPAPLAASGRIEDWKAESNAVSYTISSPENVQIATRLLLANEPKMIAVDGNAVEFSWDASSSTLLLKHAGNPNGSNVRVEW